MLKKIAAPIVPFITVGAGLLIFHNAWTALLSYHFAMVIVVLLSKATIPPTSLIRSNSYKIPLVTPIIGASGGLLLYALWPYLSVPGDIGTYARGIGLTPAAWPLFIAYYICINPFIEEYYWRGFLGSASKYPIINDILFAGYHLIVLNDKIGINWLIMVFLILTIAAWFWRRVDIIAGGILPSYVSHLAADTTIILSIYIWISR